MDPLAVTIEIFVLTITGAVFGGLAMLTVLEVLTAQAALKNKAPKHPLLNAIVQKIQLNSAQQAENNEAHVMPKAA